VTYCRAETGAGGFSYKKAAGSRLFCLYQYRKVDLSMALPKVGNIAPDFSLPSQYDEKVSLKQFRGKKNVVLYFYPKAMTPGCTDQACGLRDSLKVYQKQDTVVLGVSPDPISRLQKFAEKYALGFHLLSDENHAVADSYGVWSLKKFMGREFMGIVRTTFIIGKDGRLKRIEEKVKTKTHHDVVAACLRDLGFNSAES
jgi:thioredoxin-dependent peroxiredoxin